MDTIRALAICLTLGLLHMLAQGAWLWLGAGQAPAWLRLCSLALLLATALLCAIGAMRLRRLLLWRRRRSPRPSREVQLERRRIAGDLHDGVGALLVHAMALLEPGDSRQRQVHGLLEQAMLDLRLMVDSMDAMDDALPVRLARLRHRLQLVLDRRGMQMHWNVAEVAAGGGAGTDAGAGALQGLPQGIAAQHLVAIAQEAVSNVLQHAQARTLWLVLEAATDEGGHAPPACWELRVEDDGCGMAQGTDGPEGPGEPGAPGGARMRQGMGLAGMQRRAQAMGARLLVQPRPGGGTTVRVRW